MDHYHHPSSSSTSTKEEEEDLSHDDKKAKTNASSPSSGTTNDYDLATLPPPQPAPLHLCSLPDIVHDAIASYLTMKDMHCMMESSQWLLKAYGGRAKELRLARSPGGVDAARIQLVVSIITHRPGVTRLALHMDETMGVVVEAMREGYLNNLQALEVTRVWINGQERERISHALCDALSDGVCPKINALVIPDIHDLVPSMGKVLQSRMTKGCCGLKSVVIRNRISSLSPLLSSGACDTLEELKLQRLEGKATEDLSEWLLRTKAAHLRAFVSSAIDLDVAHALCSPGVAPRLQVLELDTVDASSLPLLSQAIGGGAWPHLREFRAEVLESPVTRQMVPSLVEAIGMGARELTTLKLGSIGVRPEGGMAVARMLRDSGYPGLEELDLSYSKMGDDAVVELARALEGGAPCTTLRRLNLNSCGITSVGMRELMESMGRRALPHLDYLNLVGNSIKYGSVVALAQAMAGGALRSLQELRISDVGMEEDEASALFQALRDHNPCPHLKKLSVSWKKIGYVGVLYLAKAIEAGALQHLQELDVSYVNMGEEGFKSLVKAIVAQQPNPGCPRLEVLDVDDNKGIGDGGVMYLAEMMKVEGAMQHLRVINIVGHITCEEEVRVLSEALSSAHICPNLKELKLGFRTAAGIPKEIEAVMRRAQECLPNKLRFQWY